MAKDKAPAKPAKDPRGNPHDRIDAIVAVLKANGFSLPPDLGGLHPAGGAVEE